MRDRTSQTDDSTSQHEDVTADTFLLASLAFGRTVVPVPNRNRERLVNKLGTQIWSARCRMSVDAIYQDTNTWSTASSATPHR